MANTQNRTITANQRVVLGQLYTNLMHIVTEYGRKQSDKRNYNHYALAHYLGAARAVCDELGDNPYMLTRTAIVNHFEGQLCNFILRALGFKPLTDTEATHVD